MLSFAASFSPQHARGEPSERDEKIEDLGAGRQAVAADRFAAQFERALLGEKDRAGLAGARARLGQVLSKKIRLVDRVCGLDEVQKRKLELAGRGDVKQLFDRVEAVRSSYSAARLGDDGARAAGANFLIAPDGLISEMTAVRAVLNSGPFDDESLFTKTLNRIL